MQLVKRLLIGAKGYWKYLIIGMFAIIGQIICQLYTPIVIRNLTILIGQEDENLVKKAFVMSFTLLITAIIGSICYYLKSYYNHYAAWKYVADLRVQVYSKIQSMSLKYFHDKQTGQLMSRVLNDTSSIELLIAHAAPDIVVNFFMFIGVATILFTINPYLAFFTLFSIPFLAFLSVNYAKKVRPMFRERQKIVGELSGVLQDNIIGIKEIQVFNQSDNETLKVSGYAHAHADSTLTAMKKSSKYHAFIQFFTALGTVIIVGFGGAMAFYDLVPIEDIIVFVLYLSMFYAPILTLARVNEDFQNALAGAERIFEVLDAKPDVEEKEDAVIMKNIQGDIEYRNVNFHYIEGIEVLRNVSINIKKGEIIAVVGPTGVGKTTFINLITRFYDPVSGDVLIDGINLKDTNIASLHDNISIVLQDIFLFNGTVTENISYGSPMASREDVMKAAQIAMADEFIQEFENGYDTMIGERGVRLSGGQKQRLSIARAVLRNKPILILDEATASVDMHTEKMIHEAMDRVMENRTTIIIAHRLSTVKKAHRIIVLNNTVIEEMGTHETLLEKDGLYAKMWNTGVM